MSLSGRNRLRRLRRAGCDRDLFVPEASVLLHEAIAGAMRDLDRLAGAAVRAAARAKRRVIERNTVERLFEAERTDLGAAV